MSQVPNISQTSIAVQNLRPGPTTFCPNPNVQILFEGKGDPSGNDIQSVPAEVVYMPEFAKAVRRGMLKQLDNDDPAIARAGAFQDASITKQAIAEGEFLSTILEEPAESRDLVMAKCLISGQDVAMRAIDVHVKPPLAPEYAELLPEFIPTPTGELTPDGTSVVRWTRVIADPPQ